MVSHSFIGHGHISNVKRRQEKSAVNELMISRRRKGGSLMVGLWSLATVKARSSRKTSGLDDDEEADETPYGGQSGANVKNEYGDEEGEDSNDSLGLARKKLRELILNLFSYQVLRGSALQQLLFLQVSFGRFSTYKRASPSLRLVYASI